MGSPSSPYTPHHLYWRPHHDSIKQKMAGGKRGRGRPKKKLWAKEFAKHNDAKKTCIGARAEMNNSLVNGSFNHTNNTTSSSVQVKKGWATRRVIEFTKSCRTSTRPVFSRDMYDAVPDVSKEISEQNTRTKNGSYHRLHGTIRQQNELL